MIDDSVRTVKLEYKDAYTPIVYGDVEVNNERIPTSIKIKKMTDFFNTSTMKFEAKPLEGAIFGVYTAENISIIPKDTLVDLLTTGADGVAVTTSKLPFGKYYLRELKLPYDDIHLSQESFPLEVKGTNLDYFRDPIWNERFKGNIALWKEDESTIDRMLEGAQYEIRDGSGLLYRKAKSPISTTRIRKHAKRNCSEMFAPVRSESCSVQPQRWEPEPTCKSS